MKHIIPELDFAIDSLQPFMSQETLEFHYGKHHKGYIDKLNQLIIGTPFEDQSLEQIIKNSEGALFNNAAQVWNHSFFWKCLKPKKQKTISSQFLIQIENDFGSMENFKNNFVKLGTDIFGSGWLWLILQNGKLILEAKHDADNPLKDGQHALLTCDLWEHAYYIDYRNDRLKYLQSFVEFINWDFVEKNLEISATRAA